MPSAYDLVPVKVTHDPNQRIDTSAGKLPEIDLGAILDQVKDFVVDFLFPAIKDLTGIDLSFLGDIFEGIDFDNPGGILAAITSAVGTIGLGLIQQVIDAVVSALTGHASTGNPVSDIGLALINAALAVPAGLLGALNSLLAALAGQQAQITAIQNNPGGASQTDDFTTATLSGRTNVAGAGTMAISTRGPYLQTTAFAADYMGTVGTPRKPATHKCGTAITVDPNMRGACRGWICGDNAMANYAAVEVYSGFDGDAARIVTGSSPSLTVIRSQVDVAKITGATVFDIKYDPTPNTFTVLRNGQAIGLAWVDSGNVVTHTSGKTFVGAVENTADINEDGFYGPAIRKQTFYDW